MKHRPSAGVIPPRAAARILFDPPIEGDESPMLLTPVRGYEVIVMEISPSAITLTNKTDQHVPFVLVVVPQNPNLGAIFEFIKQRLKGG